MFIKRLARPSGFTLVELMVVFAIIFVLLAVVLASFSDARRKSRDDKRKTDLANIELALKLYYELHDEYPNSSSDPSYPNCDWNGVSFGSSGCLNVLVAEGFLQALPSDPGSAQYNYDNWCSDPGPGTNNSTYRLAVRTESGQNGLANNWWHENDFGFTTCKDPS